MKHYKYNSYDDYVKHQVKANKKKLNNVWVQEDTIKLICDKLIRLKNELDYGLCHGTRRGVEQALFNKYLGGKVIGTEISDTAIYFPNTIKWDFHNIKEEWINSFDYIYTNSLDHAYDPRKALRSWLSCLKENGVMVIEWSEAVGNRPKKANKNDPFFAKAKEIEKLIKECGGVVVDTIRTSNKKSNALYLIFARRISCT